ncbi:MAG: DUF998 domain-containing protein [Anaerolineales bacterium]|nr:DUF998 domain-containing protein [Anaerolineales bacterium]
MKLYPLAIALITAVILAAHLAAPPAYDWRANTISELGAQGYSNAWIMRLGFAGFCLLLIPGGMLRLKARRTSWPRELPLILYGACIGLSGAFSTQPFLPEVSFSQAEANLHSLLATSAGVLLSLSMLLYMFLDSDMRRKFVHLVALILTVAISALFGMVSSGAGIVQRILYLVGFAWLVFIDWQVE